MNTETKDTIRQSLDLDGRIEYEVLENFADQGVGSFVISAINAGLVFFVLRDITPAVALDVWLGAMVFILLARFFMVFKFWRTEYENLNTARWLSIYLLLIYATGLTWGVLPLFDAFYGASWSQAFIIFVIAGMSAGGLVSLYVKLTAAVPYLVLILAPLIITLAMGDQLVHVAMSALASLYLILLVRSTYYLNAQIIKSIRLEAENQNLFDFLLQAKKGPASKA